MGGVEPENPWGPLVQARFTDKAWGEGGAHTSSHNTLAVGPGPGGSLFMSQVGGLQGQGVY